MCKSCENGACPSDGSRESKWGSLLDIWYKILMGKKSKLEPGSEQRLEESKVRRILKAERRRQGLTQKQVAELIGTTQATISDLEVDKNSPRLSTVIKVSYVLGLRLTIVRRQS